MKPIAKLASACALVATMAAAGCTTEVVDHRRPGPPPPKHDRMDRGDHDRGRHDRNRDRGRHDRDNDRGRHDRDNDRGRHDRDRDRDRGRQHACTREYAPVCAVRGNDRKTFPNSCEARSARYTPMRSGRC